MSIFNFRHFYRTLVSAIILFSVFLTALPVSAGYTVHDVKGNVMLVSNGKNVPLKKGMSLSPSDMIEIPQNASLEIFNDLDSEVYTSVKSGRNSVMRIMLDAKQKASDNSASVNDQLSLGNKGGGDTPRIYVEKGMVKRAINNFTTENLSNDGDASILASRLYKVIDRVPGMVGIAFVSKTDTLTINNGVRYPMMSVSKLHQALAVADALSKRGETLDTTLYIPVTDLDKNTWSPMLKKYGKEDFQISVGELLNYSLSESDNNASNILFKRIVSPAETDKYVKSIAQDPSFAIRHTESEMKKNYDMSYLNHTSPLSAALLMRQLFTTDLLEKSSQDSIKSYLTTVTTGKDRLGAVIEEKDNILFAHKTGSGYRNTHDELIALNDVGYFRLPDGNDYALAVFIRDFAGTEEEASFLIADISRRIYDYFRK